MRPHFSWIKIVFLAASKEKLHNSKALSNISGQEGRQDSSRVLGRFSFKEILIHAFLSFSPFRNARPSVALVVEGKTAAELLLPLYVWNLITRSDEQIFFFLALRLEIYYLCIHDVSFFCNFSLLISCVDEERI